MLCKADSHEDWYIHRIHQYRFRTAKFTTCDSNWENVTVVPIPILFTHPYDSELPEYPKYSMEQGICAIHMDVTLLQPYSHELNTEINFLIFLHTKIFIYEEGSV